MDADDARLSIDSLQQQHTHAHPPPFFYRIFRQTPSCALLFPCSCPALRMRRVPDRPVTLPLPPTAALVTPTRPRHMQWRLTAGRVSQTVLRHKGAR